MTHPDAVVVGGGVVGASVAYHLARAGLAVRLLERGDLAAGASGAAAGMLRPIGEADAGDGAGAILAWGLRSLERMPALVEELRERSGIDPEYEASGALYAAGSPERADALRRKGERLAGCGLQWLEADAVRARVACAGGPDRPAAGHGALWSPGEGHVRSERLCRAFAGAATALGARCDLGTAVHAVRRDGARALGVETRAGRVDAGAVVLCPGVWTSPLCDGVAGWTLPVEPVRGQSLALDAPASAPREIWVTDAVYLVRKRDGSLVVGATEEHAGFDAEVTAEGVARLLRGALAAWPALGGCAFRGAWAGLRPATPDRLPAVGPVPGIAGLFVAAGHFRNGVLLSPVTGELVADAVTGRALPDDAAVFDPARFSVSGARTADALRRLE